MNNIFETRAEFLLAGTKVLWDEGGERIPLRPNRFQCAEFCFQRNPLYVHIGVYLVDDHA